MGHAMVVGASGLGLAFGGYGWISYLGRMGMARHVSENAGLHADVSSSVGIAGLVLPSSSVVIGSMGFLAGSPRIKNGRGFGLFFGSNGFGSELVCSLGSLG